MRLFEGTQFDRPPHCERCDKPETECVCPPLPTDPVRHVSPEKQTARLSVEKRKRGKMVTVIRGLAAADNDLKDLLSRLKTACGAGGSIDDDVLVIQGSQLDRIRTELASMGYRIKG